MQWLYMRNTKQKVITLEGAKLTHKILNTFSSPSQNSPKAAEFEY